MKDVTKEQVTKAIMLFNKRERPKGLGNPRNSYIKDENGTLYPTEIIYALATGMKNLYTTHQAEAKLRQCDI